MVASIDESITLGIIIFSIGVAVGFACVVMVDWYVRRQLRIEHDRWIGSGRPERRYRERRT